MSEGLIGFSDQDLISFNDEILKVEKFNRLVAFDENIEFYLENHGYSIKNDLDCETLRLGDSAWKKGKLRLRLVVDFIPEEIKNRDPSELDSSLDQIRQMISESE